MLFVFLILTSRCFSHRRTTTAHSWRLTTHDLTYSRHVLVLSVYGDLWYWTVVKSVKTVRCSLNHCVWIWSWTDLIECSTFRKTFSRRAISNFLFFLFSSNGTKSNSLSLIERCLVLWCRSYCDWTKFYFFHVLIDLDLGICSRQLYYSRIFEVE